MSRRGLWAIGLGLACGIWSCGCQSTGAAIDGESRAPSFGVDRVPRQSEPEVDEADVGRRVASSEPESESDADAAETEPAVKKSGLLTRLIPSRDKESPERKALPVSKRSAGADSEESEDEDNLDF